MGLCWLLAQLPYSLQFWLGHRFGDLLYSIRPKRARVALRNISACFPELSETEQQQMLHANMRAVGLGFFEMLICWFGSRKILQQRFEVRGGENLTKHANSGVILLAFHFTNIELCGAALASRFPLLVVYRRHDNAAIEAAQRWGRLRHQKDRTAAEQSDVFDRSDVRGMVKALRTHQIIWLAADQDLGKKRTVFAPFFGIQAATPVAPAKLAASGRAKVVPVVFTHPEPGHYRITIKEALENYPSGEDQQDAVRFNAIAEQVIRAEPQSYLWVHRRFKTRPDGQPPFYENC